MTWFGIRKEKKPVSQGMEQPETPKPSGEVSLLTSPRRWIAAKVGAAMRAIEHPTGSKNDDLHIAVRLDDDFGKCNKND